MQTQPGTVVSVDSGSVTVAVDKVIACARCAAGKGCGAGLSNGESRPAELRISLPDNTSLRAGDAVEVSLESDSLLRASALAYGLPLGVTVASLGTVSALLGPLSDATAVAVAVLAFAFALLLGRARMSREGCIRRLTPRIGPGRQGID